MPLPESKRKSAISEQLKARVAAESGDGRALVNDLENNPICSIGIDQKVRCISVVWKRYATSVQIRFIHEHIIHLLEQHQITKVLGDDSALAAIHADDQKWIVEDWVPRAKAAGLRVAASKTPVTHFARVSVEAVQSSISGRVLIRTFEDIAEARNWLLAQ